MFQSLYTLTITILSVIFFFFQAEDGIRDYKVTGVQTCALPIWNELERATDDENDGRKKMHDDGDIAGGIARSEERRVGKEGKNPGPAEQETRDRKGSKET